MDKIFIFPSNTIAFKCPACDTEHCINMSWDWNNDKEKPTFWPSVLVTKPHNNDYRCHSFITDGKIKFLDDCTHELKGQTVDLPDINSEDYE